MQLKLTQKVILVGICMVLVCTVLPIIEAEARPPRFPTYTGHVRDMNGGAISGAYVRLFSNGYQVSTDYTDGNGYYCVGNDYVNLGYIRVEKAGWITTTKSVSSRGGTYNFNLRGLWALVVGGETEERFTRDAFGMYNTLIDHYGFSAARIYLLTTRTTIDSQTVPRDRATSRANVEWATNQIEAGVTASDQVVVYWTGHGSVDSFATDSDSITANQLDSYLDDITCQEMYIFLGPCHSGSFIDNLNDTNNRAIYTSCESDEGGHAYKTHSYWPWAVYRALDPGTSSTQNAEEADDNNNWRVSLWELYDYAYDYITITRGYTDQHPQRWVGSLLGSDSDDYLGNMYYK